jgi:hypothetical protein
MATSKNNEEIIDLVSSDDENVAFASSDDCGPPTSRKRPAASAHGESEGNKKPSATTEESQFASECISRGTVVQIATTTARLPFVNSEDANDGVTTVTDGILPAITGLQESHSNAMHTCTLDHMLFIQQSDKWSCGFRNAQMMLSAILPLLSGDHAYFSNVPSSLKPIPGSPSLVPIPSLRELQDFIERSWRDGFDARGAQHYRNRLVGRAEWIGAVEVCSMLAYLHIDSVVVQFISCQASRKLLGPFVWAYFSGSISSGCQTCRPQACEDVAQELLAAVSSCAAAAVTKNGHGVPSNAGQRACDCSLLPLFLQWKGHSVTVVGIEKKAAKTTTTPFSGPDDFDLILFDPIKDGDKIKQSLARTIHNGGSTVLPAAMRLPTRRLLNSDCQILMCSTLPLTPTERAARRTAVNSVTAELSEVMKIAGA